MWKITCSIKTTEPLLLPNVKPLAVGSDPDPAGLVLRDYPDGDALQAGRLEAPLTVTNHPFFRADPKIIFAIFVKAANGITVEARRAGHFERDKTDPIEPGQAPFCADPKVPIMGLHECRHIGLRQSRVGSETVEKILP